MPRMRAIIVDPAARNIREIAVASTLGACSVAVGDYLRFGILFRNTHALYVSGAPETTEAFAIGDRLMVSKGLVIGAGRGGERWAGNRIFGWAWKSRVAHCRCSPSSLHPARSPPRTFAKWQFVRPRNPFSVTDSER
jgi:hypothetical protein